MLQFIDQNPGGIGSSDRRRIRSHVMRGKNAGKRREPSQQKKVANIKPRVHFGYSIPRQILWSDVSLTSFPVELDSVSKSLMHRWFFDISDALFPPQFCSKFDIIKSIWVNCILKDAAYFHSTLAICASYVDFLQRQSVMSIKALHHIAQAYALVNIKLSGPHSVSDSALAAVVSLAIYQQVHHQPTTGLVHLRGLHRMIELRGGIAILMKENRALGLKPLRLDIELAMKGGTNPLFRGAELPLRPVLCDFQIDGSQYLGDSSMTPPVMLDILKFSWLLNQVAIGKVPQLDPLDFTETVIFLLYALMDILSPIQTLSEATGLDGQLLHLAMLAFMSTLLPEYTRDRSGTSVFSSRLADILQKIYTKPSVHSDSETRIILWIIFVSGMSVLDPSCSKWLSPFITQTCDSLNLTNWNLIEHELRMFPWIDSIHGIQARCLWEDARVHNGKLQIAAS